MARSRSVYKEGNKLQIHPHSPCEAQAAEQVAVLPEMNSGDIGDLFFVGILFIAFDVLLDILLRLFF